MALAVYQNCHGRTSGAMYLSVIGTKRNESTDSCGQDDGSECHVTPLAEQLNAKWNELTDCCTDSCRQDDGSQCHVTPYHNS